MSQTSESKLAYIRDDGLCQWHLRKLDQVVGVFSYRDGYISAYAGTHHVMKRSRVDKAEAIISLCAECHYKCEHAIIKKIDVVALLSTITGVDLYHKYRSFCKWDDTEWQNALLGTGTTTNSGYFAELEI